MKILLNGTYIESGGRISFTDQKIAPEFSTTLWNFELIRLPLRPNNSLKVAGFNV